MNSLSAGSVDGNVVARSVQKIARARSAVVANRANAARRGATQDGHGSWGVGLGFHLFGMPGRKPFTPAEEQKVLVSLKLFPLREQALFILSLNTGYRITELLSLDVGHVWDDGKIKPFVKITRARLKGGSGPRRKAVSSRTVPINAAATEILSNYIPERFEGGAVDLTAPLFPSQRLGLRMSRWRANVLLHRVVQAAGLEGNEGFGTHTLRKTFAQKVYKNSGHDINLTRAVLGHAEITTTQKYLHVEDAEVDAAILQLGGKPAKPAAA